MASSTSTTPTSNYTESSWEDAANYHVYVGVSIFSIIFLFLIFIPTLLFNGMTLFAIYKDPLNCFKNPLAMFVKGVLIADFISGLIVYPFLGAVYAHDLRVGEADATGEVYHVAFEVLMATITISFLTLLGLAVSQLIAVHTPLRFERYVSVRGVKIGLICVWIYTVLSITVSHFIPQGSVDFFLFFLIFHVSVVTVALVILHIVTYLVFSIRAAKRLDEEESKQVSKDFFKGTCLLALVQILLVWPEAISLYIESFLKAADVETEIRVETTLLITDNLLFTKFLLDPIILVWRVPKYQQAMKIIFPRCFGAGEEAANHKTRVAYSRSNSNARGSNIHDDDSMEDVDVEVM